MFIGGGHQRAEAHTMGGELEFAVTPTDALLLKFAGSYVEAEFDSTVTNMADGSVIDGIQDGNRIPSVPNWQLSAVATYTFPGLFNPRKVTSPPPGSSSAVRSPSPVTRKGRSSRLITTT